ncbi:MAG TPA: PAS domain-containing protein [Stellaceae bacterium]|nr:PAS domain-containing protein [Stellaceae bacterium]
MNGLFADQLGDPMLRSMYEYWRRKCAGRAMPSRRDIDPSEIPKLLPHMTITEVIGNGARFRYRLSGTAVTEAFGRSLTGQYVDEVMKGQYRDLILRLYRNVCLARRCVFCESKYTGSKNPGVTTKRLLMPLSEDGTTVSQVLAIQTFLYASHDRSILVVDNMDEFTGADVELTEPRSEA